MFSYIWDLALEVNKLQVENKEERENIEWI